MKRSWCVLLCVIIAGLGYLTFCAYQDYQYQIVVREVRREYNEEQKKCKIYGTTLNYVFLTRETEDYKELEGAVWRLTNVLTKRSYTFETNREGEGGIVGVPNGEYVLQEEKVPQGETLTEQVYKVHFDHTNQSYSFVVGKDYVGAMLLVVRDQSQQPVEGVKFQVFDYKGEKVHDLTSNQKGLAAIVYSELYREKIYYVEQVGVSNPKRYFFKPKEGEVIPIQITIGEKEGELVE